MSEYVADASAILAFARGEPGEGRVGTVREDCIVSALNLLEAFSKLLRYDLPIDRVQHFLRESFPRVISLDREQAEIAAELHAQTRKLGLSYADCVCLSLGRHRKATVLTADRSWQTVDWNVKVELIR